MSDSVRPRRRQPTRLLCPWDSPGENTGVGCHFLLQCMKVKSQSEIAQSSDSQQPHGLQPTRLLRPWDFPGKSTGVGFHCNHGQFVFLYGRIQHNSVQIKSNEKFILKTVSYWFRPALVQDSSTPLTEESVWSFLGLHSVLLSYLFIAALTKHYEFSFKIKLVILKSNSFAVFFFRNSCSN